MELTMWANTINESVGNLWAGVIEFLPRLIIALIILLIGWLIGVVLDNVVTRILRSLKIDEALKGTFVEKMTNRAGFKLDVGAFLGGLVKWFVIAAFLIASMDVLQLNQVNVFLQDVVLVFLPQLIVAVLILLAGALIGDFVAGVVRASASGAHLRSANFLAALSKWAIWIFAALAALFELGVAAAFIQTLFTGVIVALSLAFGLSFGLGGQDHAERYIEDLRKQINARD